MSVYVQKSCMYIYMFLDDNNIFESMIHNCFKFQIEVPVMATSSEVKYDNEPNTAVRPDKLEARNQHGNTPLVHAAKTGSLSSIHSISSIHYSNSERRVCVCC